MLESCKTWNGSPSHSGQGDNQKSAFVGQRGRTTTSQLKYQTISQFVNCARIAPLTRRYALSTKPFMDAEDLEAEALSHAFKVRDYILSSSDPVPCCYVVCRNFLNRLVTKPRHDVVPLDEENLPPELACWYDLDGAEGDEGYTLELIRAVIPELPRLLGRNGGRNARECDRGVDTPARAIYWDVTDAMASLPDNVRKALEARGEGRIYAEIAEAMGVDESTVWYWCNDRGPREILRTLLEKRAA